MRPAPAHCTAWLDPCTSKLALILFTRFFNRLKDKRIENFIVWSGSLAQLGSCRPAWSPVHSNGPDQIRPDAVQDRDGHASDADDADARDCCGRAGATFGLVSEQGVKGGVRVGLKIHVSVLLFGGIANRSSWHLERLCPGKYRALS
jgi:hypothetical protein